MKFFIITFLVFFSYESQALVENRIHYGIDITKDNSDPFSKGILYELAKNHLKSLHGVGIDTLIKLPILPLRVGLRYTTLKLKDRAKSIDAHTPTATITTKSLALLANYRIIDSGFFLGTVGTIGLLNYFKSKIELGSNSGIEEIIGKKKRAYSIGVESGMHITDNIFTGIELGYHIIKAKKLSIPSNYLRLWDNSEVYMKFMIGTSF